MQLTVTEWLHHRPTSYGQQMFNRVLVFWEAAGMAGKSKTAATRINLRAHAPKTTGTRNEFKWRGIDAKSVEG